MKGRSTGELLILMVAGTVCFSVLATGAMIALLSLFRPEVNTDAANGALRDTINTLIGVLAGFLAGKTDATKQQDQVQQQIAELHQKVGESGGSTQASDK